MGISCTFDSVNRCAGVKSRCAEYLPEVEAYELADLNHFGIMCGMPEGLLRDDILIGGELSLLHNLQDGFAEQVKSLQAVQRNFDKCMSDNSEGKGTEKKA